MYLPLTDVLTCPSCGPEFGLVLLADRIENRRVLEGWLGCANCEQRWRIEHGFVDLSEVEGEVEGEGEGEGDGEAVRLAALLGITEGPAVVLLVGSAASSAGQIADMIEGIEVIAAAPSLAKEAERPGVNRIAVGARLPFRNGSMRGVVAPGPELIAEAARVTAPRARLVILSGADEVTERLEQSGLRVIARDAQTTVAQRSG